VRFSRIVAATFPTPHKRKVEFRGRPSANAANSYLEFPACKSQKFGHWANIRPLLEKAKKLNHLYRKFGPFEDFFAKKFGKI
jgi:hypothetical protein